MSTIKVNTIQSNTTAGVDVNSPLETVPSIDVTGSASIGGGLNVTGVVTATTFSGDLTGNVTGNATGLSGTPNITVGNIIASSATISGNVSVAGTLTYEDVTNVDSVGLVTARTGVRIDAGGLVVVGVTTVAAGSVSAPSITPTDDSNTGIFFPSADTIAFGEGGSEAARFDSSGRLLVGTSSARSNFFNTTISAGIQLEGLGDTNRLLSIVSNTNDAFSEPNVILGKTRGTSLGSNTVVQSGDPLGSVCFQGADGSEFVEAASIKGFVDSTPGANDMPGRLVFSTTADGAASPTERMRISSNGQTSYFTTSGIGNRIGHAASAGTSSPLIQGGHSASDIANMTTSFYVWTNGNVQNTNNSYTIISDAKLKENIVDANSQWEDIKAVKVRNWNFKEETGYETHRQIGPVAQELESVCPGLVFETQDRDKDGNETGKVTKGINTSVLYMKAVKALQEAMERIEQLEAKVAALEAA